MLRPIPYITLLFLITISSFFIGCTNLEKEKNISKLNEMSERIIALEHSFNQDKTSWVNPVDFQTLENTLNDIQARSLLDRKHYPMFSNLSSLIIDAMALYTAIPFAENQEKASELIYTLNIVTLLIDDKILINTFEEVKKSGESHILIWLRLEYLLWNALAGNILDSDKPEVPLQPTNTNINSINLG